MGRRGEQDGEQDGAGGELVVSPGTPWTTPVLAVVLPALLWPVLG
ncbi:hypothetical protein RCG67_10985 [Kocuria sp. CPCC 205292]